MLTISVYYIFIILLLLKTLVYITDYKYLILILLTAYIIYYLHENNKVKINVELLNNINKIEHFEEHVDKIYMFLQKNDEVFNYNTTTKKEIYEKINFFINELRMINENHNFRYCELYLEKNYDLFIDLNNLFNSLLIVYPTLSHYNKYTELLNEFNHLLTNVFKFAANKCKKFNLEIYKTYDKDHYKHSFDFF